MELKCEKLNQKNEKILSKLDDKIGINKNKQVLREIIKCYEVMKGAKNKLEFENYNIIIRNESSYVLYEDLINVIAEIYLENGIIHNSDILYLDRLDYRINRMKNIKIEEDVIVIDFSQTRKEDSEVKKMIEDMMEQMPQKTYIIIENKWREGDINALMSETFSWAMKIESISSEEKEKFIEKFMKENKLKCKRSTIIEIAENPYYKIKNILINILVNSKTKNEENVEMLLDKNKNTSKNNRNQKRKTNKKQKAIDELDGMIGMSEVKEQISKVVNYIKVSQNRDKLPMLHMCFYGNPGTGKTTVARILGKIFTEEKILSDRDSFVEAHGRDLVGMYVGWTAGETKRLVRRAEGGVLFIDEAYSLISDKKGGYEEEAIATLLKEMEDKRDKVCIIMAGYENKMEELLQMNPGFESRIQFKIFFPDYTSEELYEIFKLLCKNEDYKLSSNIKQTLLQVFEIAKQQENFSNGRFVRSLFEKVKMEQANRVVKNKTDKNLIKKCDIIETLNKLSYRKKEEKKRVIGFSI
ncbi:MAG: AAA family ATPase [Clostridia bacterium]|nr:AAA family ATPase [Clostridia bacterium]